MGRKKVVPSSQQRTDTLDLNRLVDPKAEDLDKDLLCQICMDIVQDPTECKTCQTVYCVDCVNDWKKNKNQCPNQCTGKWVLQAPHKKYKQSLSELKFKCIYADKGCSSLVTFDNYKIHESSCTANGSAGGQILQKPAQNQQNDQKTQNQQQKGKEEKKSDEETKGDGSADVQNVWWCFKGDNGKWCTYEADLSQAIETNYQANKLKFFQKIGPWDYEIDLVNKEQINRTTLKSRQIHRKEIQKQKPQELLEVPQEIPQPPKQPKKVYKWQWLNKDYGKNEWNDYAADLIKTLEEGYEAYENKTRRNAHLFKFQMRGNPYELNFEKNIQKNINTGYEREVKRVEDS